MYIYVCIYMLILPTRKWLNCYINVQLNFYIKIFFYIYVFLQSIFIASITLPTSS